MRISPASTIFSDLAAWGASSGTRPESSARAARALRQAGRQDEAAPAAAPPKSRQEDSVSVSRAAAEPEESPEAPAAAPVATAPAASGPAAAVNALQAKLAEMGFNVSGLEMNYTEETVGYPGGSYLNRQIKVTNGTTTQQFDALLTARNPEVAAVELAQIFNLAH